MDEFTIEVKENGIILISNELYRILLDSARKYTPKKRGVFSKKSRVKKRIVREELNRMLREYIKGL